MSERPSVNPLSLRAIENFENYWKDPEGKYIPQNNIRERKGFPKVTPEEIAQRLMVPNRLVKESP